MSGFALPPAAKPIELLRTAHLEIVSRNAKPPAGEGWLHEVTYDGHRLVPIIACGDLKLISRKGHDRTALFRQPFEKLAGLPPFVLGSEIAVPDDKAPPQRRFCPDDLADAAAQLPPARLTPLTLLWLIILRFHLGLAVSMVFVRIVELAFSIC
jgi:hypothetical protein